MTPDEARERREWLGAWLDDDDELDDNGELPTLTVRQMHDMADALPNRPRAPTTFDPLACPLPTYEEMARACEEDQARLDSYLAEMLSKPDLGL